MLSHFSVSPLETGYRTPTPASMRVFPHPPIEPLPLPADPNIPLHWGIEP